MTCLRSKVFRENPSCSDPKAHALSLSPSHPFLISRLGTAGAGARQDVWSLAGEEVPVAERTFQNMALGVFPNSTYCSLVILQQEMEVTAPPLLTL